MTAHKPATQLDFFKTETKNAGNISENIPLLDRQFDAPWHGLPEVRRVLAGQKYDAIEGYVMAFHERVRV